MWLKIGVVWLETVLVVSSLAPFPAAAENGIFSETSSLATTNLQKDARRSLLQLVKIT